MALVGDCRLSGEGEWSGKGRLSGRWFRWLWGFGGWGASCSAMRQTSTADRSPNGHSQWAFRSCKAGCRFYFTR